MCLVSECAVLLTSLLTFNNNTYAVGRAENTVSSDNLLIVYDSSNSMWGELSDESRKYQAERSALKLFLDTDLSEHQIALRAYGHRDKDDCRDSELVVPFSNSESAKKFISSAVAVIRPTGKTLITYSLGQGLEDFNSKAGDILLVSDGIETCDADRSELMRDWQDSSVNIRVHVVGVCLNVFSGSVYLLATLITLTEQSLGVAEATA